MNTEVQFILEQCREEMKESMCKVLVNFRYPQVFQTGFNSGEFRMDREAEKFGWTSELQHEYYTIHYDELDTGVDCEWA